MAGENSTPWIYKEVIMENLVAITQCDELPLVLTPMDIAKVLNISKNTAYEMVHSKDFPCFKVGKSAVKLGL